MFGQYDPNRTVHVCEPYKRRITPVYMTDTVPRDIEFSVHVTEWEPGCVIEPHSHDYGTEAMYCMEGKGTCLLNGEQREFVPGVVMVAHTGDTHEIRNTGDTLLRVLCVFSPPVSSESFKERAAVAERARREMLAKQEKDRKGSA